MGTSIATHRPSDWSESTLGSDAAAAAASHAVSAETQHYLTMITASFDEAAVALLTVTDGSTIFFRQHVHSQFELSFDSPLTMFVRGKAITASLASGGSGVAGQVTIAGYSD
jgi:hypothetical protein